MDPTRWGPKLCFFMDTLAMNYPTNPTYNDKINMKNFFEILKYILPCEECRLHYVGHLDNTPIDNYLNSKENLIMWVLKLHNNVNESLNKPTWTIEQFMEHYTQIYSSKCNITNGKCGGKYKKSFIEQYYTHISISFLVCILGLIIFMIQKRKCI